MATVLSEKITDIKKSEFVIGRQVLDILTSGMYDNPLMVYREYIQNAADSLDQAYKCGLLKESCGHIKINVNGLKRSITITDNGVGIHNSNVERVLLSIGYSSKEGTVNRGFRGIGRLGGLAYCKKLKFETRSNNCEKISVVVWDQNALSDVLNNGPVDTLEDAISLLSSISFREPSADDPAHFFSVTMEDVERFHTDELMDIGHVKRYLAQVAPVPYDRKKFRFADKIETNFRDVEGFRTYSIKVNGEKIFRPYTDEFLTSKERIEKISEIDFFSIADVNGATIAKGWFAKTSFMSSLPPSIISRGIRVRQGNIEVGNEYFLADFFAERRFATWQIGEIQICGASLKTNARRDGFEHTLNYETFLERAGLLGSHLSKFCREASKNRCARQKIDNVISEIRQVVATDSIFLNDRHYESAIDLVNDKLDFVGSFLADHGDVDGLSSTYEDLKNGVEELDPYGKFLSDRVNGQILNRKKGKKIIEELICSIKDGYYKTNTADELIEFVLAGYLKTSSDPRINLVPSGIIE